MTERRPARRPGNRSVTAAELLGRLPEPRLDVAETDDDMRRIELRRAVLEIAGLDHATEISLTTAAAARYRQGEPS